MDNYVEHLIKKKTSSSQYAKMAFSILVVAVGCFVFLFQVALGAMFVAIGIFFAYLSKQGMDAEYEYTFTNGDCDIALINSKVSRKNKYAFGSGDVHRILPYSSDKCRNELEVNTNLKLVDFTSGYKENDKDWYVFFANEKNTTVAIALELNERCIEHIKKVYKTKCEEF